MEKREADFNCQIERLRSRLNKEKSFKTARKDRQSQQKKADSAMKRQKAWPEKRERKTKKKPLEEDPSGKQNHERDKEFYF